MVTSPISSCNLPGEGLVLSRRNSGLEMVVVSPGVAGVRRNAGRRRPLGGVRGLVGVSGEGVVAGDGKEKLGSSGLGLEGDEPG